VTITAQSPWRSGRPIRLAPRAPPWPCLIPRACVPWSTPHRPTQRPEPRTARRPRAPTPALTKSMTSNSHGDSPFPRTPDYRLSLLVPQPIMTCNIVEWLRRRRWRLLSGSRRLKSSGSHLPTNLQALRDSVEAMAVRYAANRSVRRKPLISSRCRWVGRANTAQRDTSVPREAPHERGRRGRLFLDPSIARPTGRPI
jgi:hypothetical protein